MNEAGRAARALIAACTFALGPAVALAQDGRAAGVWSPVVAASFNGVGSLRERALWSLTAGQREPGPLLVSDAAPAEGAETGTSPHLTQAYACLIGGTGGMLVAAAAGAENLVNTIAGGIVATQNRAVLFMGVAGIVFASFCTLGQALTPVYLYYSEPAPAGEPAAAPRQASQIRAAGAVAPTRVNFQAGILGGTAAGAARRIDATPAIAEWRGR